jgi:hypothetical protein
MDTILYSQSGEASFPMETGSEKSDLMLFFENQLKDSNWAYRDLLRAIFETDEGAEA